MASSTDWTSIPVHPAVRDAVRDEKPDGMSYSDFLRELVEARDDETQGQTHC